MRGKITAWWMDVSFGVYLVENFQPYAVAFREKNKFFAYFCVDAQEWALERFYKVKIKLFRPKNVKLCLNLC